MLVTLALVILSAAIVVFFSQEFLNSFKKLFSIPGVKLLLPLFVVSWLVYTFDFWVFWFLSMMKYELDLGQFYLINHLPASHFTQALVQVALLTILSVLPVSALSLYYQYRCFKPYPYPYLTSSILWLIAVVIFVML